MKELKLKYGCNPNQSGARLRMEDGGALPVEVLNGNPGYINFLDALNAWQLVRELRAACSLPAAASFKHVSPAGAALGLLLSDTDRMAFRVEDIRDLASSPLACAYARARGTDRLSSFGDWIALSDSCDEVCARVIQHEVSDGVIAPGYDPAALEILKSKRKGGYNIVQIDPDYEPPETERKQVFGVTFEQARNSAVIDPALFDNAVTKNRLIPPEARRDLTLALLTLKYTQSNSVCYAVGGQTTGVGAGQQSRVHCTRLAGNKSDIWHLRHHEKVLALPFLPTLGRAERDNAVDVYVSDDYEALLEDGVWQRFFCVKPAPLTAKEKRDDLEKLSCISLASDAFFPFADNIDRAYQSGVSYIAQPGGSIRDAEVVAACDAYGIAMAMGFPRLFHH
ncbi:MAG: phosphoribosylaminoimidazolecarboxamide formyltransferase [Eubacteriales bacterium]|nr:phosphoribosylaminoimidazolecarboxamide formyltransferase [Eubacteriales bacterium]